MTMAALRWAALAAAVVIAAGCATPAQWERYGAPARIESPQKGFSLEAPSGWRRSPDEAGDRVLLTADGAGIQYFLMLRVPADKVFSVTKAKPAPDASPRELGELVLAEIRASNKQSSFETKTVGETVIDGRPAFRLHLAERTARGAQYERVMYGVQAGSGVVVGSCRALSRYFFERALPVCEQTLRTVKLGAAQAAPSAG